MLAAVSLQFCLKFHIHSEYTDPFQTSLIHNLVVTDPAPSCFYLKDTPPQDYSPNTVQPSAKRLRVQSRQVAQQSLTSNPVQYLAWRPQMQSEPVAQ
jgi:hypothetical protein